MIRNKPGLPGTLKADIVRPMLRRVFIALFWLLPMVLLTACDSDLEVSGVGIDEFRRRVSAGDREFLRSLPLDDFRVRELNRRYPGGSFFLGETFIEAGMPDRARTLFEASLDNPGDPWFYPALRELRRLYLSSGDYDLLSGDGGSAAPGDVAPGSRRAPDPGAADWFYAQRFEAMIQLGEDQRALKELRDLREAYPEVFAPGTITHSLLYYQALLGAGSSDSRERRELIEPYVFISDARGGHANLAGLLDPEEDSPLPPWIQAKAALISGKSGEAFEALEALALSKPALFLSGASARIDEGFPRDLYAAALASGRHRRGAELFRMLRWELEDIPESDPLFTDCSVLNPADCLMRLELRLGEYQARLLNDAGDHLEAALIFEENMAGFAVLEARVRAEAETRADDGTGALVSFAPDEYAVLRDLTVSRERQLWLWIGALMDAVPAASSGELIRAYSFVRNPGYFRDITREYLAALVDGRRWDDILSLANGAGPRMPSLWRGFSLALLDNLARQDEFRFSSDEMRRLISEAESSLSLWNRSFLRFSPEGEESGESPAIRLGEAETGDIAYLLPLTRSISAVSASLYPIPPEDADETFSILYGYLDFALYDRGTEYLIGLAPGYVPDRRRILDFVARAYADGDWYGGLRLLETVLYRDILHGSGVADYVEAAGSPDALLYLIYPRAYRSLVEDYAVVEGVPTGLFYALMREESRFNPTAGSRANAQGLGQIIPSTGEDIARRMGLTDYELHEPSDNISMSAFYLAYLRGRFSGYPEALAAYNAGQGRVDRWLNSILPVAEAVPASVLLLYLPIEETRDYVPRVLESWQVYEYLYGGDGPGPFEELRRPLSPQPRF
jgi:hypothetical protein